MCYLTPAPFGDVTYVHLWEWLHPPWLEPEGERGQGTRWSWASAPKLLGRVLLGFLVFGSPGSRLRRQLLH